MRSLAIPRVTGAITCPANGTWVGLPYLNRFYTGNTDGSGNCTTFVAKNGFNALTISSNAIIEADVTVSGTVTVNGGAIITASIGAIYVLGTLNMPGTSTSPISLTTASSFVSPGQWGGIAFRPGSSGTLSYVHLSYAGRGMIRNDTTCCENAGVLIEGTNPSITNSTIDFSSGDGVAVRLGAAPTLDHDTFSNENGTYAVRVDDNGSLPLLTNDTFRGNSIQVATDGADAGFLAGSTIVGSGLTLDVLAGNINSNATWLDYGAPIRMKGDLTVPATTTLTMPQPITVTSHFGAIYVLGTLTMTGTPTSPISLTAEGTFLAPGRWDGIAFRPGSSGTLSYVHLSYAGRGMIRNDTTCCENAGVLIEGTNPSITNSTIDFSSGDGVAVRLGAAPTLDHDTFSNENGSYAVRVDDNASLPLLTNDTFRGNSIQVATDGADAGFLAGSHLVGSGVAVDVLDGALTVNTDTHWIDHGAPYHLKGNLSVPVGFSLTMPQPVTVTAHFSAIYVGGTLNLTGTATNPISLIADGTNLTPGRWGGIVFRPGSSGTLSYVHLSYAGRGVTRNDNTCCDNSGLLIEGTSPSITSSTIDFSSGDGIVVRNAAPILDHDVFANNSSKGVHVASGTPTLTNDVFSGNGDYAVFYDVPPGMFGTDSALSASRNGHDAIGVGVGTVAGAWDTTGIGLPVVLTGNLTIPAGQGLSVAAGSTFYMGSLFISLSVAGTLTMAGTEAAPIVLTSPNRLLSPGQWYGIDFQPGSDGSLSFVHLSYGGRAGHSILIEGGSPTISNSTIDASAGNDVEVTNGGQPVLHDDIFGAVPAGRYGVVSDGWSVGSPRVDATNNWWGDPSGPSGAGPGTGVPVGNGVNIIPWFTNAAMAGGPASHYAISAHSPQATGQGWSETITALNSRGITNFEDTSTLTLAALLSGTGTPSHAQFYSDSSYTTPVTQTILSGGMATVYVSDSTAETIQLLATNGAGTITAFSAPIVVMDPAAANTVTVPGATDLYLAGQPAGLILTNDEAPQQAPVAVPVLAGTAISITASGVVTACSGCSASSNPDASNLGLTSSSSQLGLSGVTAPYLSLVGVFAGSDTPNPNATPPALDFSGTGNVVGGTSYHTLSPQLQQVFFIGDGLTGTGFGQHQTIHVPAGATRLYLAPLILTGNAYGATGSYSVTVRP